MRFTAKSEKEVQEEGLLPKGNYSFEISDAKDEVSKSGNEMIKLILNVYDENGNSRLIFDYLLESIAYKLRHAAEACGLLEKYESELLIAEDFKGKTGIVSVGIQKDKTGNYPDKNTIKDYVIKKYDESPKDHVPNFPDEDLPF